MKSPHDLRKIAYRARKRWGKAISKAYDDTYPSQTDQERKWHNANINRLLSLYNRALGLLEEANLPTTRFEVVIPADQSSLGSVDMPCAP
jgi:hypothetical protein